MHPVWIYQYTPVPLDRELLLPGGILGIQFPDDRVSPLFVLSSCPIDKQDLGLPNSAIE